MPERQIHKSVALHWDESLPAPLVVAKGSGRVAERMDKLAESSGVPVIQDDFLVAGLEPIDIGEFVPPEYWELVAHVLAFIRNVQA